MFRPRVLFALVLCAFAATPAVPQEMHPAARTTPAKSAAIRLMSPFGQCSIWAYGDN